ncbi:MAG: hypothetical protein HYR90_01670 [Candidatus Andersenbacteria bacterium]|nr:hypothetical protein [Candidatus Andersenbacteria bacterium]MBI3250868.1 hypothetical protein [Candidatus Andersenbacteria bacterium]
MTDTNNPNVAPAQNTQEMLEKIYVSTEKTRKLFLWTLILSIIAFVLPLIGLVFAIPFFLNTYVTSLTGQLGL